MHITRVPLPKRPVPDRQRMGRCRQWQDHRSAQPSHGSDHGIVAHASIGDLHHALAVAQQGFLVWPDVPSNERAATMRRSNCQTRSTGGGIFARAPILINS